MNSFRDKGGRFRTMSLFWEKSNTAIRVEYPPIYTLKDEDYTVGDVTYKSARKIYLAAEDITEYQAALDLVGSWAHWQYMVANCKWFRVKLDKWREELEVMLRSRGVRELAKDASSDSRSSMNSAKYLAERGWAKSDERGRPSKKKVAAEAQKHLRIKEEVDEELERMEKFH